MHLCNFLLVEPSTVGSKRPFKALESNRPNAVKSPGPAWSDGWWTENCKVDGICGGGDRGKNGVIQEIGREEITIIVQNAKCRCLQSLIYTSKMQVAMTTA